MNSITWSPKNLWFLNDRLVAAHRVLRHVGIHVSALMLAYDRCFDHEVTADSNVAV